jgi:hypothetical protein
MTTTEAWRDNEGACGERPDWPEAGDRSPAALIEIGDRVPAWKKASPTGAGITPAEAELLAEYNLHNG